jgi:hypothetical protein
MSNLKTTREYLLTIEKQLELLRETKEALLRAEYSSPEDLDIELPRFKIVFDQVFPRCLRYSFVVFLYSVVETELESLCSELRKRRKLSDGPASGKVTPLEQCKTFLSRNYTLDFGRIPAWEALLTLEKVRDCIAHTGGRVEASRDKEFLETKAKSCGGLSISDQPVFKDRLYIEQEFCLSSTDAAITFFDLVFEPTGFGPAELTFEE